MRLSLLALQLVFGAVALAGGVIALKYLGLVPGGILGGLLFVLGFAVLGWSVFGVGRRPS